MDTSESGFDVGFGGGVAFGADFGTDSFERRLLETNIYDPADPSAGIRPLSTCWLYPERTRTMTRAASPALLLATVLALTACGGADGADAVTVASGPTAVRTDASSTTVPTEPSAAETSDQPSAAEPDPGTTVAPAAEPVRSDLDVGAPEGWQTWRVDRVVFALPEQWEPDPDRTIPSASASFFLPLNADGETVAAAAFFVETGAVGPLGIRTDLLEQIRNDQTGTEPVRGPEELDVPGSAGASRIDYAYDVTVAETGRSAPSLQVDVTIQMADPGPQYGIFFSGTQGVIDEADLTAFAESFQVLDEQGQLVG